MPFFCVNLFPPAQKKDNLNLGIQVDASSVSFDLHCFILQQKSHVAEVRRVLGDFPGGPVVKNLPCNAGNTNSIPGQGTKISHPGEQLSPRITTKESDRCNERSRMTQQRTHVPQLRPETAKYFLIKKINNN